MLCKFPIPTAGAVSNFSLYKFIRKPDSLWNFPLKLRNFENMQISNIHYMIHEFRITVTFFFDISARINLLLPVRIEDDHYSLIVIMIWK